MPLSSSYAGYVGVRAVHDATRLLQQQATDDATDDAAAIEVHQGAWTRGWDVVMCLLPIAFLVVVTTVPRVKMNTSISLPLAALFMWTIRLAYLQLDPAFTNAAVLFGMLDALTPLSIIAGAICLFETMEETKCLEWIMTRVRSLSAGHPVAEVFLIAWAFAYMIEGASGFGTPVALAAPMLVSLGHPAVPSIACCLIMNTLATVYGAVGTPLWFGLAGLDLSDSQLRGVGQRAQVMLAAAALVVPLYAASFLVRWRDLVSSWPFVAAAIAAAVVPAFALSFVSLEFSSLIGGMAAVTIVGTLARFRIGLNRSPGAKFPGRTAAGASAPLGAKAAEGGASVHEHANMLFNVSRPVSPDPRALAPTKPPLGPRVVRSRSAASVTLGPVGEGFERGGGGGGGGNSEGESGPYASSIGGGSSATAAPHRFSVSLADGFASVGQHSRARTAGASTDAGAPGSELASAAAGSTAFSASSDAPPRAGGEGTGPTGAARDGGYVAGGMSRGRPLDPIHQGEDSGALSREVLLGEAADPSCGSANGRAASGGEKDAARRRQFGSGGVSVIVGSTAPSDAGKDGGAPAERGGLLAGALRTLPLWLTVLLLLLTRIDAIGVREQVQRTDPHFTVHLGTLFHFRLSASLVVSVSDIFAITSSEIEWSYALLYVPFLVPFVLASAVTVTIFRRSLPPGTSPLHPFLEAAHRVAAIVPALMGSLVLVALIRKAASPGSSPAYIIGANLSDFLAEGFIALSATLGALGSFFSGSTTVSNLTFGVVQQVAARGIDVSEQAMLALQALGATAGNMVCINNIISARTVVGGEALPVSEGAFIMRTAPALAIMLVIGTLVALPFLFL